MWAIIFQILTFLHWLPIAISNETEDAVIIKEVCVPHQIAELERYLEEHDLPEVPISNTAAYTPLEFDNDAMAEAPNELDRLSDASGKIELMPFGALSVDWKRLRLLQELLISPQDQELRSKLLVLSKILLAASQRVRKHPNRSKQESTPVPKNSPGLKADPKKGGEEISSTPNSKTGSTRHRFQRSTYKENTIDEDGEGDDFSFSSSAGTQTPLNIIPDFSEAPELDEEIDWNPESKVGIPQLEDVEEKFKDNNFGEEIEGPFEKVAAGKNSNSTSEGNSESKKAQEKKDIENSDPPVLQITPETINEIKSSRRGTEGAETTTEEIKPDVRNEELKTITTESPLLLPIDENMPPSSTTSGKIESSTSSGGGKNSGNSLDSETRVFSNPKSFLISRKAPEGVLKIVTTGLEPILVKPGTMESVFTEKGEATTEEIKSDVRNEDFKTIETFSKSLTTESPLLLPINEEKPPSSTTSGKIESSTSSEGEKNSENSLESERKVVSNPKSFLVSKKSPEGDLKIVTTGLTQFSKRPGASESFLIKKGRSEGGRHVSRMHNFDDGERALPSRIDSSTEYSFYDKNEKLRPGQESPLIFSGDKLLAFKHFARPATSVTPSILLRHEKRSGIHTDVEKLYRWFYRGGEIPEKFHPRGDVEAVIKCKNRRN